MTIVKESQGTILLLSQGPLMKGCSTHLKTKRTFNKAISTLVNLFQNPVGPLLENPYIKPLQTPYCKPEALNPFSPFAPF